MAYSPGLTTDFAKTIEDAPGSLVVPAESAKRTGSRARRIRVGMIAAVPAYLNPYVFLMQRSVGDTGAVELNLQQAFSPRWFFESWGTLDILHLHWLEYVCAVDSNWRTWRKLALFIAALMWCRAKGIKIVYSVHNLNPHTLRNELPYAVAGRFVFSCADAIHVHEKSTVAEVARRFGRNRGVHVIAHGNYIGAYPNECSPEAARRILNLDEDVFVYLFVGQVRANKGIEGLIVAFSQVKDPSLRLVIAGWAPDGSYGGSIARLASGDNRISLRLTFVPDDELQYYFNASDVCVLPYKQFTTSGAVLLALSFGRPIIGPNSGTFADVLTDGTGILYEAHDDGALVNALRTARESINLDSWKKAFDRAHDFDWTSIAAQHVALYTKLLDRR